MVRLRLGDRDPTGWYGKVKAAEMTSWKAEKKNEKGAVIETFDISGLKLNLLNEDGTPWTNKNTGEPLFATYALRETQDGSILKNCDLGIFIQMCAENYGMDQENFETDDLVGKEMKFARGFWRWEAGKDNGRSFWNAPIGMKIGDEWVGVSNSPQFSFRDPNDGHASNPLDSFEDVLKAFHEEFPTIANFPADFLANARTNPDYEILVNSMGDPEKMGRIKSVLGVS